MNRELEDLITNAGRLSRQFKDMEQHFLHFSNSDSRREMTAEETCDFIRIDRAVEYLMSAKHEIDAIYKEVLTVGELVKNSNGRYEVNGIELTSGHPVEYYDEEDDLYYPSRIEHKEDYYIVSLGKDKPIDGVRVRIK